MKSQYIRLTLITVAAALVLFILWAVQGGKDPHNFEGRCSDCHVGMKDPSILTRDANHLCLSCHPDNAKRSHPSGIVPNRQLPAKYPLYRGKMVCVSCHFPHRRYDIKPPKPGTMAQPGPYMLRAARVGKVFCFSCHQGSFDDSTVDSHAISMKRAHTKPLDFDKKELIDDNSRECLSCHDGTISSGTHATVGRGGVNWEHRKKIGVSHPISISYQDSYLRKPRAFHPPENLDPRITLINGMIGCETCHNHYSKNKKHLVMDNFKSRLCLSCHNL